MTTREPRAKATFPFMTKPVETYRPTPGQAAAFSMITAAKTNEQKLKGMHRFFGVIEAVVVHPSDWEWMEEQLITGNADVPDYARYIEAAFSHAWDDEAAQDAGE